MPRVDAHLDIAWNALDGGRGFEAEEPPLTHLVTRSTLLAAGVDLVFATLFAPSATAPGAESSGLYYETPREARLLALSQLAYYRAVGLRVVESAADLEGRGERPAAVLLMEGADPIETTEQAADWFRRGVRIVGLAWGRTRYAGGTGAPGGLTDAGRSLLAEMERLGMALDISHLAEEAVGEALASFRGPVISSHANARRLVPGDRQIGDGTARAVAERGGVLGVSFFKRHLTGEDRRPTMEDVVAHLVALAEAAGGPEFVGLGTDLDGGFEKSAGPLDRYQELFAELRPRLAGQFSPAQVEGIEGGNWWEWLRRSLPRA